MTTLEIILMGLVAVLWIAGAYSLVLFTPVANSYFKRKPMSGLDVSIFYTLWPFLILAVMFSPAKRERRDGT